MVEHQPSKLRVAGSSPVSRSDQKTEGILPYVTIAHVAQSVEHVHGKHAVIGSNPIVGSVDKH